MERIMWMNGGNGETSYDRMSVVQAYALKSLQPSLAEAVHIMNLHINPSLLRIADFGSATGRNSLACMDFVVACIRREYQSRNSLMPEIQAFFNDLPANDFNTLFSLLPPMKGAEEPGAGLVREYFAAGVPGSFYRRLFLRDIPALFALDFTGTIPAEVTDPESELYNRGSCWIMGGKPSIAQAFAEQSKTDLRKFLQCRAAELVPGGILHCYLSGRADCADPTNQTIPERQHRFMTGYDFEGAWDDLIEEGIITEETWDAFNLPIYIPSLEEIQDCINTVGGFEVIRLEHLEDLELYSDDARMRMLQEPKKCAKFSSWVRSLVEPLMVVHMGSECTDEWFLRHERRVATRCRSMLHNRQEQEHYKFLSADFLLVVLKKL
uniref:Uncharacterized protein n=1 Tax=Physcomitrium patens TaxID=3218 RepID=A0A2K1KIB2_PHYPA|nr:hypothetical protein PHYPA_007180 [Physcomitrium patens]